MCRGDGAPPERAKDLAVLFAGVADTFGRLDAEDLCAFGRVCFEGRGRVFGFEEEGLEEEDAAGVIDHVEGVDLGQVVVFVDAEVSGELVEPGFELEGAGLEEGYPLGAFVERFWGVSEDLLIACSPRGGGAIASWLGA